MTLITSTIPNLNNGVSQQPDILRLSSQGNSQLNGLSSVVEGLIKRPPSEWKAKIEGITENAYFHAINRDENERYMIAFDDGDLKVYTLDGVEQTVNFPDGKAYLNSLSPKDVFQCVTVADFTFILNKSVVAKSRTQLSPVTNPDALVWVRQGQYGATYRIRLNNTVVATYTVPNGSTAADAPAVTTDNIAAQLRSSFQSHALAAEFTEERIGSTLRFRRNDGGDFTISVDSPQGDSAMSVVKGAVQRFNDLPARAVQGFTVEITGDNTSEFDNYYVTYETGATGTNDGVWKESVKGGEEFSLDASTMPHALIREADSTFTFRQLSWSDRTVGDSESAPFPSFVGRKINDVFFFRNRLGFASDENVIMSASGDFFNFFRGTATSVLDSDPIDVGISHVKVSLIEQVVPFNQSLLLFSNQTQFQTGAANILTAETISINPTTEYECSLKAKPVGVGKYVYFATNHGNYSGVREYFVDEDTESEQAAEITAHVPKFIQGDIRQLAASSSEDILVALTEETPETMYIYKYYFSDQDKLQASWSKWTAGGNGKILSVTFFEANLYVLIGREDGVHLELMNLSSEVTEEGWDVRVHLDSKLNSTELAIETRLDAVAPSGNNPTQITLPYKLAEGEEFRLVTGPEGPLSEGVLLSEYERDNTGETTKLLFDYDLTTQKFYVGRPYSFRYSLSTLIARESSRNGGQVAIKNGRLQLRRAAVYLSETGYLRAEVTPYNRNTYRYVFTGNVVGSAGSILGKVNITDGVLNFPIMSKNTEVDIEFINDTHLPSGILSLDWEGLYSTRTRRV